MNDRFPVPDVVELIDESYGSRCFLKLDLRPGYHHIKMNDENIRKTAFRTHEENYEFLVLSFGLTTTPTSFQATMNHLLKPFLRKSQKNNNNKIRGFLGLIGYCRR